MSRKLRRSTLCSTLAIATALAVGPRPAAAQSFIGTVNSEVGAHVHVLGNGQTTINVQNTQAVIDWTTTGASNNGVITFQPAGTTAVFQGNNQFAVLNRVTPGVLGSAILLDGTIQTSVNGNSGGGTIFFSSPNGIIVGANAIIDVGSLGLTALPIAADSNGNWMTGFGTPTQSIQFGPASNAAAFVRIDNGANVGVGGAGSYIALVAPKVDLQGTIKSDGVAALVAAEQATLTIRDSGLWDIVVQTGTSDPNGLTVGGRIARNSAAIGGNHTAYLVSVAKNDAVTMLFSGGSQLGFDIAGSAGVEGNSVVLSAGGDVINGSVGSLPAGQGSSSITLDGLSTASRLLVSAHGDINVTTNSGASTFGNDVTLRASNQINVAATQNNLVFAKSLSADSRAVVGADGNANGGDIHLSAVNGKALQVQGTTTLIATATGGSPTIVGNAGDGRGGHISIVGIGGGDVVLGTLNALATGTGGIQTGTSGANGAGFGGMITVSAVGGGSSVQIGNTNLDAQGVGGSSSCAGCAIAGGNGTAGGIGLGADGAGSSLTFANLAGNAIGSGGNGGIAGGSGRGGFASVLTANGGSVTATGTVNYLFADGFAGSALGIGNGGAGIGGSARIFGAGGGGTISFNSNGDTYVTAEAVGGQGGAAGGNGGNATGGNASISAGNAALSFTKRVLVRSDVIGGSAAAGIGGNAVGGPTSVSTGSGSLIFADRLLLHSYATGGTGLIGGNGTGGAALIAPGDGSLIANGAVTIDSHGTGGSSSSANGIGGIGTGGLAQINSVGGSMQFNAATTLNADGLGGAAIGAGATGGGGRGGTSETIGSGGTATFANLTIHSNGSGGAAALGSGGSGVGGIARLRSDGGTTTVTGDASVATHSTGGAGIQGGSALATTGTDGTNARISSLGGTLTVNGTSTVDVGSTGGAGSNGGSGGAAAGGFALIFANNGLSGPSTTKLGSVVINAAVTGGAGGAGSNGGSGGAGGAGGNATGSSVQLAAGSTNGHLTTGAVQINAGTSGGVGGNGGSGDGGAGGKGGAGGAATGSFVTLGTVSGQLSQAATNQGSVALGPVVGQMDTFGGAGGNGGSGSPEGSGGAGGTATGAIAYLNTRGGSLTIANGAESPAVALNARAFGGQGGASPSHTHDGAGGNALTGGGGYNFSANALFDDLRSTATLGDVRFDVSAFGGSGAVTGTATVRGSSTFQVLGSDASFDSFALTSNAADGPAPGSPIDDIYMVGGTLDVTGDYSIDSDGLLAVRLDQSLLSAQSVNIHGGEFIYDNIHPLAVALGTMRADTIDITSGHNIVLDTVLDSASSLSLIASGKVQLGDLSAGGDVLVDAGTTIELGDIDAGGSLSLFAGGDMDLGALYAANVEAYSAGGTITAGDIFSTGFVTITAAEGDLSLGSIQSLFDTQLFAGGNIQAGDIQVGGLVFNFGDGEGYYDYGQSIDLEAGGTINAGNLTASDSIVAQAGGDVTLGHLSAGLLDPGFGEGVQYRIGVLSGGSIDLLSAAAASDIGLGAVGDIHAGAIDSGGIFLALAGGNMDFQSIRASGPAYLADASMIALGDDGENDFNPAPILAADPVRSGGSITIHGATDVGSLQAAAGTGFSASTIDAHGLVSIDTGGNAAIGGAVHAGGDLAINADGAISAALLDAGGNIDLASGSATTLTDAIAGGSIDANIGGALNAHDLSAGGNVSLLAGSIGVRNIAADQTISLDAGGIAANDLSAGLNLHLTSSGNASVHNAVTGGSIDSHVAGTLSAVDLAAGGDIALFGGAVSAHDFRADGSIGIDVGSISLNDLMAGDGINLASSGNATFRNASAGGSIGADVDGMLTAVDLSAGGDIALLAGSISAHDLNAGGSVSIEGGSIALNDIVAGAAVDLGATGNVAVHDIMAGGAIDADVGGTLTVFDLDAGGDINLLAAMLSAHNLTADGSVSARAATSSVNDVDAAGDLLLATSGNSVAQNLTAGGSINADIGGALSANALSAGGSIDSRSAGATNLGDVAAGSDVTLRSGATLTTGAIGAGGSILLGAVGDIAAGSISAGENFLALGGAGMTFASIESGGTAYLSNLSLLDDVEGIDIGALLGTPIVASGGSITISGDTDVGALTAFAGGDFSAGDIVSQGALQVQAAHNISAGSIESFDALTFVAGDYLRNSNGSILTGDVAATGAIGLDANGTITSGDLTAGNSVTLRATGAIAAGDIVSGASFGGEFLTAFAEGSGDDVMINSGASVSTGDIDSAGAIAIAAVGDIGTGALTADGYVIALGGGNIHLASVDAFGPLYLANRSMMSLGGEVGGDFNPFALLTAAPVATPGSILIDGVVQAGALVASAGTSFQSGAIGTTNGQRLIAGTTITITGANAGGSIDYSAGTGMTLSGPVFAGGDVDLESNSGAIALQAVRADHSVDIESGGTVSGGGISAGDNVSVWGASGVALADLDAGIVNPVAAEDGDHHIGVGSEHDVTLGALRSAGDIGIAAGGNLTLASAQAGGDTLALIGGNGTIGTVNVAGRLGIGGYALLATGGGRDDFEAEPVFAALAQGNAPATGGSLTLNGAVHATSISAAIGQTLTTAAVTANRIDARVGGTAVLNGQWNAGTTTLRSNDINIGANGGMSGQTINLISTNTAQALVGDGLVPAGQTAAGYLLDGAEFGRIHPTYSFAFVANGEASATVDLLIGDLSLGGSGGAQNGVHYNFGTLATDGSHVTGTLRVIGDMLGTNFAGQDSVALLANYLDVDSGTGTVGLSGQGNSLGGSLYLVGPHIHVASGTILDKLEANLNYSGRELDLQTATSSRPEGVVRAGNIYVELDQNGGQQTPYTVLVQNTGSAATRAGFLANYAEVTTPEETPAGAIDLVVNGQLITEDGTITGSKVRDALMEDDDPARFTAGSTINGCGLAAGAACAAIVAPPPPPPAYNPAPQLSSQLVLIAAPPADKLPFGNEEAIEDNQEDGGVDSASSPIVPPQPLFDTRPLVTNEETDEPISGGGNPALMGTGTLTLDQIDDDDDDDGNGHKKKPTEARPAANGKAK